MASALLSNPAIMKGAFAAVIASALDRYWMGIDDFESNITFGAVTGGSVLIGTWASSMVHTSLLGTGGVTGMYSDKTVSERLVEIGVGSTAAYYINTYGLKNELSTSQFNTRVMILVGTDFLSTYATEYMSGKALSYLV